MDQKQLKELQESLKKSIEENLKVQKEAIEAGQKEQTEALQKSIDELTKKLTEAEEKLAKLEAAPVGGAPAIGKSTKFLGRRLNKQARKIKERCIGNHSFETFNDEEKVDEYTKFMISMNELLKAKRFSISPPAEAVETYLKAVEKADLNEGTDAEGGYTVPDEYQWDLIMLNKDQTFALNACKVIPMGSDRLKVPKELTRGSVAWKDEAATIDQSDPTFDQVTLTTDKLTALTVASNEYLADSQIDVVSLLTDQFSYAMGLEIDNQVLNGTGDPVSGVLTAAAGFSVVMSGNHFSTITFTEISELIDKIPEGYDNNLNLVFNKTIKHYIRTLKDSQNRFLLNDPGGVTPGTVWEVPYIKTSQAPKTSGTSTAFVALGNWSYFYIGRRNGQMSLDVDPYGNFTTDQTRFRMITRWAFAIAQANAFARLITAS